LQSSKTSRPLTYDRITTSSIPEVLRVIWDLLQLDQHGDIKILYTTTETRMKAITVDILDILK